ncbi:tRNA (adenosine(37)-N6)-dimethylallyltransferase MiaA [Pedobacter hartonius]|uniref:tRNA dimethylallyltransferase n=1 Tax=Pedobacter hartonius TaxID=425514 RepID=A0A1H4HGJ0_9SPHI|nr:tRNA (adenosine(37)-N6)-dimethylallyltransferase MiaA [Pedobacter hartonius]SEB20148.1 tRNA dimethylallyltransferase [Pedobacter hartonius]
MSSIAINPLLIILGPTASGKTRMAVSVAETLNGEIISADSRQVFKDMDIGTGKDLAEYTVQGRAVPYHLINIREAGEQYNVNAFKDDFYLAYEGILRQQKLPVLCGGTGMYIHSILQNHQYTAIPVNTAFREQLPVHDIQQLRLLLSGYSATSTAHADLSSAKRLVRAIEIADFLQHNSFREELRPQIDPLVIGLTGEVNSRRERILKRLNDRFNEGLIEEVQGLLERGVPAEVLLFYGMEYKFVTAYLQNELSFEDLKEKLYIAIRQFAKRQMTFFRKMEKDGVVINWLDSDLEPGMLKESVFKLYKKKYGV